MKGKFGSVLFALAFAIPFGGVGAGATWGIASMVGDSNRAGDWVIVQAKVEEAELRTSRGSKGGSTYQALGAYSYAFEGKSYTSRELGFNPMGGSDNIGDWQAAMASLLEDAKKAGKTIPVFVNPDNPAEAVVDRGLRWEFLIFMGVFAVLFGGVGLGALVAVGFILKGKSGGSGSGSGEVKIARVRPPGATAASDGWKAAGALWGFALLWNLIAFPIALVALPDIIRKEEWIGLLVLIFPLVGLFLLKTAFSASVGMMRRGRATLTLQPETPQAGEPFQGAIRYAKGVKPGDRFKVRLACQKTEETERRRLSTPAWSKEMTARAEQGAQGVRVPFRFEVPAGAVGPDENTEARKVSHAWRIEAGPEARILTPSDGFDIEMRPAERDKFGAFRGGEFDTQSVTPSAAPAISDDTLARMLGPQAASNLTAEQRRSFGELPPEAQAMAAKVVRNAPQIKKVVIGAAIAIFALQILGAIVAVVLSL